MSQSTTIASLDAQLGVLGIALAQWAVRDDTRAQPEIRRAASTAMAAIDDMLATLHRVRQQLVTEIRRSDDANAARADAMLAGGTPAPDSQPEVSFKLTSGQSQADPGAPGTGDRS